ncbi:MAG TPA: DUF3043 domain-containing protein, partial [Jiangellaceae bacterium]|nr:DUF3043 domain-containing protein [Jiangellaceae bacterium]
TSSTPNAAASGDAPAGKGRPTPTRREAEQARKQRVRPPLTRREALKRERELARADRARSRQAMSTGDERYFLERDKGPVRRFLRDYVDSRRTVAEFFLPLVLFVLLLSFVPNAQLRVFSTLLWLATMLLVILDVTMMAFRVKREVRTRFPDDTGRGHVLYAIARSTQIRRFRLPKPTVKPGTPV